MRTRSRTRAEGNEGGDEEEKVREPELKKQVVEQFSNVAKTLRGTQRQVDKSKRVQEQVQRQVRLLRQMKNDLEQVNADLKTELQNTQYQLQLRNEAMEELEAEMASLRVAHAETGVQLMQVEEYRRVVNEQLQEQVNNLRMLNTEMSNVSDEYIQLIESDDDQKSVYIEYFADLLTEAGKSQAEIVTRTSVLKDQSVDEVKTIVEQVETLLDNVDPQSDEFEEALQKLLAVPPPEAEEVEGRTKRKKR